jgi:hypothetical protein
MLDRRAYDFVAAEFERRKRAGESPAVQVHLTSGETLVVDMVYSSGDTPGWLTFRTSGDEDATEFVPLEYVHHVTVTDAGDSDRPFGFAIEEHPAPHPPAA